MFLEAADQAGHLNASRSLVGVELVEHEKLEALVKQHPIELAQQQVLETIVFPPCRMRSIAFSWWV